MPCNHTVIIDVFNALAPFHVAESSDFITPVNSMSTLWGSAVSQPFLFFFFLLIQWKQPDYKMVKEKLSADRFIFCL